MNRDDLNEIFKRSFSLVNLPSKGKFYEDNISSLKIRYLSGLEERVLTDHFLTENGEGLYLVLKNLILHDNFDPKDLVISDLQGIMMFLYSTAYGDKIPFKTKCVSCNYENEIEAQLSQLEFKETSLESVDGYFEFYMPYNKNYNIQKISPEVVKDADTKEKYVQFKMQPTTFGYEMEANNNGDKSNLNKITSSIKYIGGIDNRGYIENVIKRMNFKDFSYLKKFFKENETGVNDVIEFSCPVCGHENKTKLNLGYDFLKLPESYRENIMEESFLISHYGKDGSTDMENLSLAVTERRWKIQRIKEEIEKKNEAEKRAVQKSKTAGKRGI